MATNRKYTGVGVMSGTSEDGMDMCAVEFVEKHTDGGSHEWEFKIKCCTTVQYSKEWKDRLKAAPTMGGYELVKLDVDYGHLVGREVGEFINSSGIQADYVASHGHTIFHRPEDGVTFQIGDGETTAAYLSQPLVTNFRVKDVALGGQGAPLVPCGERKLFKEYSIFLNLGGIANVSFDDVGFDVAPCNMVLNYLAARHDPGLQYDPDGSLAAGGKVVEELVDTLDWLPYCLKAPPKSTGRELVEGTVLPILDRYIQRPDVSIRDVLRSYVEHIAVLISNDLALRKPPSHPRHDGRQQQPSHPNSSSRQQLLITGGGALNKFLVSRITEYVTRRWPTVTIADVDENIVNFKEALVFAFLGLCTLLERENIAPTVTGARAGCISGSIHLPAKSGCNCFLLFNPSPQSGSKAQ